MGTIVAIGGVELGDLETFKNGTVMKELIENKSFKNTDELFVK